MPFRGIIAGFGPFFVSSGITFVYILGALLPWRWVCLVCALLPGATTFAIPFLPETPIWLVHNGKIAQAEKVGKYFHWLHLCAKFVITSLRQPTLRPVFLASLNKKDIIRFDIESLPKFISNPWFNFHKKSVLKWPRLSLSEVCHFKKLFGTLSKIYDCYLFLNATEYQFTCALR